jgi:hypothetical protein
VQSDLLSDLVESVKASLGAGHAVVALRYTDEGLGAVSALSHQGLAELGGIDEIDEWAFVEEWPEEQISELPVDDDLAEQTRELSLTLDEADEYFRRAARAIRERALDRGLDVVVVAIPIGADDPPDDARASLSPPE